MSDRPGDPGGRGHRAVHDGRRGEQLLPGHLVRQDVAGHATVIPTVRLPRTAAEYETIGDGQLMTDAQRRGPGRRLRHRQLQPLHRGLPAALLRVLGQGLRGARRVWLNGSFGTGVTAHELGHNYGVHHANLWQTTDGSVIGPGANVEYGNVFDVMGRGGVRGPLQRLVQDAVRLAAARRVHDRHRQRHVPHRPIDDPAETGQRALKIVKDADAELLGGVPQGLHHQPLGDERRHAQLGLQQQHRQPSARHHARLQPTARTTPRCWWAARSRTPRAASTSRPSPARPARRPWTWWSSSAPSPATRRPRPALAASATTVPRNAPVTLTVTASDANGDALAYGWEFDDGTFAPNAATVTKSWSTSGTKVVRCIVSDMVGGTTATTITITVGTAATFSISGTVTSRRPGAGRSGRQRRHPLRHHQRLRRLHHQRRAQRDLHR